MHIKITRFVRKTAHFTDKSRKTMELVRKYDLFTDKYSKKMRFVRKNRLITDNMKQIIQNNTIWKRF